MEKAFLTKLRIILQSNLWIYAFFLMVCFITLFRCQGKDSSIYSTGDIKVTGTIIRIKHYENYDSIELQAKEKLQVISYQKLKLQIGDIVSIEGTLERPKENRIEHLFNYRNYLKSKNIYWIVKTNSITIQNHSKNVIYLIKNRIINKIEKRKYQKYYKVFFLGDQSQFNECERRIWRKLGISHLFVLSGMHLSIFSVFLLKLLSYTKLSENKKYIIVCVILGFYVSLTNQSVSLIRAFSYFCLITINRCYRLKFTSLQLFFYLCMGYLLLFPRIIYDIGFLYSFTVSFFVIYFKKFIQRRNSFFRLSFVAYLASIPITLAFSFELNLCSIIINLIVTPFISFIFFPLCILSFFFPLLEIFFAYSILLLENTISFFSNYGSYMITFKYLHSFIYVFYLGFVFISLEALQRDNKLYLYIFLLILTIHHFIPYFDSTSYVTFFDVGQGDSSLIELPRQLGTILIDTGGSYRQKQCYNELIPALKSKGIHQLDILILTHGDYDHMGDVTCILDEIKVKKLVFNTGEYNDLEKEVIKTLDNKKIRYYKGLKGVNISGSKLQFVNTKTYDNENDNSNVIYFNYNNYKFLFMGDAGIEREKDILEKYNLNDIDFLKVGHHGSNTSSSKEFIESINPKYSLISVGKNNRYGHPKESVLDTLSSSKIYRTDISGSIQIKLNKNGYKIKTCLP